MALSENEEFELLSLEREKAMAHSQGANPGMGGNPPLSFVAKQVLGATPMAHPMQNLPLLGAMVGSTVANPGLGAAAGAGVAQIAKNAYGIATGDPNAPRTAKDAALSAMGQSAGAGIAQEPQVLQGIPGVPQASQFIGKMASKGGKVAAKIGEMMTGVKAKDLEQAADQGLSTYSAPSMEKAQDIFGDAMAQEGIPSRPPLKQVIDPALSTARKVALQVGDKLEKGLDITAEEALRGRQAVDRIYNATPLRDRVTRGNLADIRTSFDAALSDKSGALADASTKYRQAIVKSNILNPFRITKQGQYSAVAPMIATLAATAGVGSGHKEGSALGGLGYLAASSPMLAGLAATTGGSAGQAINSLAQNPAARQVLMQLLEKLNQGKSSTQGSP